MGSFRGLARDRKMMIHLLIQIMSGFNLSLFDKMAQETNGRRVFGQGIMRKDATMRNPSVLGASLLRSKLKINPNYVGIFPSFCQATTMQHAKIIPRGRRE